MDKKKKSKEDDKERSGSRKKAHQLRNDDERKKERKKKKDVGRLRRIMRQAHKRSEQNGVSYYGENGGLYVGRTKVAEFGSERLFLISAFLPFQFGSSNSFFFLLLSLMSEKLRALALWKTKTPSVLLVCWCSFVANTCARAERKKQQQINKARVRNRRRKLNLKNDKAESEEKKVFSRLLLFHPRLVCAVATIGSGVGPSPRSYFTLGFPARRPRLAVVFLWLWGEPVKEIGRRGRFPSLG